MVNELKAAWPWQEPYLRLMWYACGLVAFVGTGWGYLNVGSDAFWFLLALPLAFAWNAVYGAVGKKVDALARRYRSEPGDVEIGLLVVGKMEAPGVVIKKNSELILHQITGEPYVAPIAELELLRNGNMLPGKYLWGKRGFIFEPHKGTRLAFGIAEPVDQYWADAFRRSSNYK